MNSFLSLLLKLTIFIGFSFVQVTYAVSEKQNFVIPAEEPDQCVRTQINPCSLTTGDQPRLIIWDGNQWEIDRNSVAHIDQKGFWNFYKGLVVIKSKKPLQIHTPFAEIYLGNSKVMIHVLDNKVRVMSLMGEGVKVVPRQNQDEQFLVPGFQNWYAGVSLDGQEYGVPTVINFMAYSKQRAKFFMDHRLGFVKELKRMASTIKWATALASQMNRELYGRKVASLEVKHQEKVLKKKRGIQYNKFLRKLFLKKVQYDY